MPPHKTPITKVRCVYCDQNKANIHSEATIGTADWVCRDCANDIKSVDFDVHKAHVLIEKRRRK